MEIKLETQHSLSVKTRQDQNVDSAAAAASTAADNDIGSRKLLFLSSDLALPKYFPEYEINPCICIKSCKSNIYPNISQLSIKICYVKWLKINLLICNIDLQN